MNQKNLLIVGRFEKDELGLWYQASLESPQVDQGLVAPKNKDYAKEMAERDYVAKQRAALDYRFQQERFAKQERANREAEARQNKENLKNPYFILKGEYLNGGNGGSYVYEGVFIPTDNRESQDINAMMGVPFQLNVNSIKPYSVRSNNSSPSKDYIVCDCMLSYSQTSKNGSYREKHIVFEVPDLKKSYTNPLQPFIGEFELDGRRRMIGNGSYALLQLLSQPEVIQSDYQGIIGRVDVDSDLDFYYTKDRGLLRDKPELEEFIES